MCDCHSHAPYWGPGPQPRHVPWLGIKPVTFWFAGRHSIHRATPARAQHVAFCFNKCQLGSCHSQLNVPSGPGLVTEDAMMTWTLCLTSSCFQPPERDKEGKQTPCDAMWTYLYIKGAGLGRIKALTHPSRQWSASLSSYNEFMFCAT